MAEVVYVLINQAMPGLVKIGRTSSVVEERMKQLDSSGVPLPFECFCAWEVDDAAVAEKALHTAFGDHRVRDKREFFRISPDKPAAILKAFGKSNVIPDDKVVNDEDDKRSLERARSKRAAFSFDLLGLKLGEVLHSVFDNDVTCEVAGKKKVKFRGKEMSLSAAALHVARENGRDWQAIQGPSYWKFDDQTLEEWRLH